MKLNEFQNQVEQSFKNLFPNGTVRWRKSKLGGTHFFADFLLIGERVDYIHNNSANDPLLISLWWFDGLNEKGELVTKLVTESDAPTLSGLKPKLQFLAHSSEKLGFRKIVHTPEATVERLNKFFAKTASIVWSNKDNFVYPIPAKYIPNMEA